MHFSGLKKKKKKFFDLALQVPLNKLKMTK